MSKNYTKEYVNDILQDILDEIEFMYHPDDQTYRAKEIERIIKLKMFNNNIDKDD